MLKNRVRGLGAVLMSLALFSGHAAAQGYPARPVRVVLGFPAGSTPDVVSRILAARMSEDLGQALVIDNRPGAGGIVSAEAVARAPADGYTLLVDGCSAGGMVYAFIMNNRPPLDPFRDFTPVGRIMRDHWVVVASPALGVSSFAGLVELAKAKPGSITFPSAGVGTSAHLQTERVRMRAGFEAMHVPYKDSPIPDLVAGRTSFSVMSSAAAAPLVKSGKLKGLAVLSSERIPALPEVPTSAEAGMPDLLYNAGICLYAPGGTAAAVVERLNAALNAAQRDATVKTRFGELGVETVQASPGETAAYIRELMALVDGLRLAVFGKAR